MRILLTGATGFIGRHLVPKLLERYRVYTITTRLELTNKIFNDSVITFEITNNQSELVNFIKKIKPEIVVHLAAYLTASDDLSDAKKLIDVNLGFLLNLLDALKNNPPLFFINTGTFAEYLQNNDKFDPAYFYAATKTASRIFIKYYSCTYNFKFTTMVPFSVYGSNDSQKKLMDYLIDSAVKPVDFTNGEQVLDFIHIGDVVEAYCAVIKQHAIVESGETFYVGTGKGTSIRKLAKIIEDILGKKLNINWGAREYRKRDVMKAIAPIKKNNKKIHWEPFIDIQRGIYERLGLG